ncbi:hypothetical protein RhiirC2_763872, partial [Rhizophagus irregularis]
FNKSIIIWEETNLDMAFLPPMIITGSYVESIQISGSQKLSHFSPNLHQFSRHMHI